LNTSRPGCPDLVPGARDEIVFCRLDGLQLLEDLAVRGRVGHVLSPHRHDEDKA
jgi:hypothetical protein